MISRIICGICFCLSATLLQAQTGRIAGQVKTQDGQPVEMADILVKENGRHTLTDKTGHYEIKAIEAGTYHLVVTFKSLETRELSVTVNEGETASADFVLGESLVQLQDVVVSTEGSRYQQTMPSATLRLNTPLIEVPQNIQIVTKDALRDQQVISMSDGLIRNVSGAVRLEHWGDLYTNISSRGSQIQAFRNGFNVVNSFWGPLTEDMSFVDHIEFVKGPAGFMLANGDPSGLYNVVTKKPTGHNHGEASLTMGSFDLFRSAIDLDGKLSKNGRLLYRLNLSAQTKKSHRPNEYNNRYAIAPVLAYQVDDKTRITLEYNYQFAKMSDVGSYYVFSTEGFATLPRDMTFLPAGMPATRIHDHSVYLSLEHRLNTQWKLTAQLARFNYLQEGSSMWPASVDSTGKIMRAVSSWDAKSNMSMGQLFLNGEVQTGIIRHRILAGLDMANKEYFADWSQYHVLDSAGAEFDVHKPYYGVPVNGYPQFDYTRPVEERALAAGGAMDQRYASGYLQDELGFFDNRLRLTLAGRYTYVQQSEWGGEPKEAGRFTPRAGLSFSINPSTSIYALYDEAFVPQNGRLSSGGKVKPITGENTEVGIKRNWFEDRWSTGLTVYRIRKNNELTADPNSPPASGLSIVLGQKTAQGIEFDLRGRIAPGLNLVANYAYTDSKVTQVATEITSIEVGDVIPGYARHTANIWLTYTLTKTVLRGTGISAGATWLSGRETYWDPSPDPSQVLPDYLKVDAGVFWSKNNLRITLNVFNLLDEYLYSGSYYAWLSAYNWQSEPGRNLRVSVNYTF